VAEPLEASRSFSGGDEVDVLDRLIACNGKPETIQCDQGTEFTSMAMDLCAYGNNIGLQFGQPGPPGDNARSETFEGLVRRGSLTRHYLLNFKQAATVLDSWK
jgi:putative transposase